METKQNRTKQNDESPANKHVVKGTKTPQSESEKKQKKNGNRTKTKGTDANELLAQGSQQTVQPQGNVVHAMPQMPQPQQQPTAYMLNAGPAGFVPVVPMMATPIFNFTQTTNAPNAPQQFFAATALPFGGHAPPVPLAMPQPQNPIQLHQQSMSMPTPHGLTMQPDFARHNFQQNGQQNFNGSSNSYSPKKYSKKGEPKSQQINSKQTAKEHFRAQNGGDSNSAMMYQKYKTTLCRHFEDTQTCSLGHLCSFAHSKAELRHINDPMPKDFAGKKGQIGALHSNYRTQMCRNWEQTGICKFASMCCFAHGGDQLRNMIDPVPARVPENLLFPPHLQHRASCNPDGSIGQSRGGRAAAHQRSEHQGDYLQDDSQGYYTDYEPNGMSYYNDQAHCDYGEMQPQDYNDDPYWNQNTQGMIFAPAMIQTMNQQPVWTPVQQEAATPCKEQDNKDDSKDNDCAAVTV